MSAPQGLAERMASHRINGVTELGDSAWDGLTRRLSEAHAVLCVISAAMDATNEGEFGLLNTHIQHEAIGAVQHLLAIADFHAHELMAKPGNGA